MSQPLGRAAPSEEFRVSSLEDHGRLVVFRLSGWMDAKAAQRLNHRCSQVREDGHRHLALDLSEVNFVSSSGLGVFLALTEEFKKEDGALYLVALSSAVETVVKLLNLHRFLSIVPSLETAEESLSA